MQTFSDMRRNSFNYSPVKFTLFCVFLVCYEIASAMTWIFPPLMGVIFSYLIIAKGEFEKSMQKPTTTWYAAFLFLIFCEQIHGFRMFSSLLAFLIFYFMIYDWLVVNLKWRESLLVIMVASGYIGSYLVSNLILYMLNSQTLSLSYEYVLYIAVESAIAILLFRDKVL